MREREGERERARAKERENERESKRETKMIETHHMSHRDYFRNKAIQLLYSFPLDSKDKEGRKRPPSVYWYILPCPHRSVLVFSETTSL